MALSLASGLSNGGFRIRNALGSLAAAFTLTVISAAVLAHGGGMDERGCHNSSDTGRYHCHQGPLAGESFRSEAAARAALDDGTTQSSRSPDHS